MNIPDDELFSNIALVWGILGKQPRQNDLNSDISQFSSGTYKKRFKTYNNALKLFVEWSQKEDKGIGKEVVKKQKISAGYKHTTKRDINLRLRWLVMKRDNFKCCGSTNKRGCGRTPATDPSIILHVDHIKPWVKGGETTINNLQTLCSKCNIGKSDLE